QGRPADEPIAAAGRRAVLAEVYPERPREGHLAREIAGRGRRGVSLLLGGQRLDPVVAGLGGQDGLVHRGIQVDLADRIDDRKRVLGGENARSRAGARIAGGEELRSPGAVEQPVVGGRGRRARRFILYRERDAHETGLFLAGYPARR